MDAVIYSINSKNETRYRTQFISKVKLHEYQTIKVHNKKFYKDQFLMKQLSATDELIDFVRETYYWLRELFVCGCLIANNKPYLIQNIANIFFLHYFYDFTNRIYVFNQRISLFIRSYPKFKTQELIKSRSNYNYVLMQTKFRMNYVHFNRSLEFRVSLLNMQTFLALSKKTKVEIFNLDYILSSCIKAFKTQQKIMEYIDNWVYDNLKSAEEYKPRLVKVNINKNILQSQEALRSIWHKNFKVVD